MMRRKKISVFRILFGLCVMCLVIGLSIEGGYAVRKVFDRRNQLKLMAAYEERLARLEASSGMDHHYAGATVREKYVTGDTLAILSLERLGIKVAVTEGTEKETLRISAGHFNGDLPGEGNFAVAGHSSRVYTCLFNDMHKAVVGDEINVLSSDGKRTYIVSDISIVEPTEVSVVQHENESVLTIVTCVNNGKQRLIIRGIEAGNTDY